MFPAEVGARGFPGAVSLGSPEWQRVGSDGGAERKAAIRTLAQTVVQMTRAKLESRR